ncbi:MAG: hypothetical protein AB7P38_06205 [Solirubrobacterales bacterium]
MAVLGIALAPSAGAFNVTNWEAGTCKTGLGDCTYASAPSRLYTQAAGHPEEGLTDFSFETGALGPVGNVRQVRVDLPEGLNVDPQAVPQCPKANFEASPTSCAASQVGYSRITSLSTLFPPVSFPVYNLVPDNGEPALFGFNANVPLIVDADIYLQADVEWAGDYHEGFTIRNIPSFPPIVANRLVFNGQAGGTFLTLPSPCNGPTTTTLRVESHEGQNVGPLPTTPPAPIDGCQAVPFNPVVAASANGAPTDSSADISLALEVPQKLQPINSSTVKSAQVTLQRGAGLNPATAPGLEFCPNSSFPLKSKAAVTCPAKSQIGTVAIQTPVLPPNSLTGPVYLATQESRDPQSGKAYRIFFDAVSSRYGVDVRLEGKVAADPKTGQLTGTFDGAPQVGFSSVVLNFTGTAGHSIPALSSPPICSSSATSQITPWSTGNPVATPPTTLTLTQAPGGGPCAKSMGERPFSPGFSAQPNSKRALDYTPFQLQIDRGDGQQEIKGIDITLPPGATAKLAGVSYCPPEQLASAAGKSGASEKSDPSCPGDSHVGVASVSAGTGASPLKIDGNAYLAGPYEGAPLSLAVVTPALAGPFDLGTVVIQVPIFVDPETAQIHTVTNAIPDVFGGAKLDIRLIAVNLDRSGFTRNGTHCAQMATTGAIKGGGSDPTNPASFSAASVSSGVKLDSCEKLNFKPKLTLRLFGATRRAKSPKLRAELKAPEGEANIARASVALPHAIFLKQSSIARICTRVQFSANQCPKKSVYGWARAWSPLLAKPLQGPVYLRSSDNTLPDMVAHLKGQIDIDLVGRIDSFRGGIRTTFDRVPDVPVSKFALTLPGGKHGLLVASRNLCARAVKGIVQLRGHNGKTANRHVKLRTPCKGNHRKKHGKHDKGKHRGKHRKKGSGKEPGNGGKQKAGKS